MEEQEIKTLTAVIAGRPYPLRIRADEELAIRRVVKEVNDRITHFQQTYQDRDKQDCLAMTVLTQAVELYKARMEAGPQSASDAAVTAGVTRINALLDKLLTE